MRILVIGGTGFIGSFLVRQLNEQGHDVAVFHRGQTSTALPPRVNHIIGDCKNLSANADQFKRFSPDVVLDTIPGTESSAQSLVSTIKGIAPLVVAASSIDVYRAYGRVRGFEPGPPDPIPIPEDGPLRQKLRPHSAEETMRMNKVFSWFEDDYEKIEVERIIMGHPDLPGTILRLPAVYGPGDPLHRLFFSGLKHVEDKRPAILIQEDLAGWRWSRGYMENVASAISLAVTDERATGRIYNVAEPDALTHAEWVGAIGNAAGWKGEIIVLPKDQIPEHLKNPLASEQDWVVDTTRIREELGYRDAVPREEALRRTVAWERANPPASVDPKLFNYVAEDEVLALLKQKR